MGLFNKKADPISERTKALNAQIAALDAQIKKLDSKLQHSAPAEAQNQSPSASARNRPSREPIFEPVDHRRLEPPAEDEPTAEHFNDLGVRKYDLAAAWRRFRRLFHTPPAGNPKLVTYLAAGSIKGLRPLRYEKRIARNRSILLLLILVCLVWGIIAAFFRH